MTGNAFVASDITPDWAIFAQNVSDATVFGALPGFPPFPWTSRGGGAAHRFQFFASAGGGSGVKTLQGCTCADFAGSVSSAMPMAVAGR